MKKFLSILLTFFLISGLLSGCGIIKDFGSGEDSDEIASPASSVVMGEEDAKKISDKVPIHLYFANEDQTKLKLEVRYVPMSEAKKSVNNLASLVINELIDGPTSNLGLLPTIPEGSKLRSPISIKSGVATVDFSKEFVEKHPGGKNLEQLSIYSVANSLTELKEIQKVRFLIQGKPQKEFKGNFQFDAPFPRSSSLISKDMPSPSLDKEQQSTETSPENKDKTPSSGSHKDDESKPTDLNHTDDSTSVSSGDSGEEILEILE